MLQNKTYIISLGGSLIAPKKGIDIQFIKKFQKFVETQTKKNIKFFIITGGGFTCRYYQEAAKKIDKKISKKDLDWIGISSSKLNAMFIKTIFDKLAYEEIITNPEKKIKTNKKLIIASGWKPGWSTDYVATILAKNYKIKNIINLSNIDYAYTKDPQKFNDAQKIKEINWKNFRKIVGNKWTPGLSMPFDPIASKKCEELNIQVVIANGKKLKNLENILEAKKFQGTIIKN